MIEITLKQPEDFLKVKETLTRMGIANNKDRVLYQSCHILQKQGRYYIVHFKEMLRMDGYDPGKHKFDPMLPYHMQPKY